jgi:hypothetical protein
MTSEELFAAEIETWLESLNYYAPENPHTRYVEACRRIVANSYADKLRRFQLWTS